MSELGKDETTHSALGVFLRNCSESDNFFLPICKKDENERRQAANQVINTIKSWLADKTSGEFMKQLHIYIGAIVRLANQNPFEDVRILLGELVDFLKEQSILIPEYYDPTDNTVLEFGPSSFIAPSKLAQIDQDEEMTQLLQEIFLNQGRVSHCYRIMCYYPTYLRKFHQSLSLIMHGGGPLPQPWRHYIAILSASRYHCRYLIVNQQVEFFESGGDESWLEGVEFAPKKIQKLSTINAILAHQPWLIKPQHIQDLVSGEDNWNIPELVQALTIITTFHSLAGYALGLGVSVEVDRRGEYGAQVLSFPTSPAEVESDMQPDKISQNTSQLVNQLKILVEQNEIESTKTSETVAKEFEESENYWRPHVQRINEKKKGVTDFSHYHGGIEMEHEDFNVKTLKVFRLQDYCWENQGYSLLNRYYPGAGDNFDDLFTETLNLTDYTLFNSKDIDTSPFRQAVWYYVLRLKGMCHDDYMYSQVNACLNQSLKKYIKKVACFPQLVTITDYTNMGIELFDAEKVHINFLILESKKQAELLHALSAIMYFKGE